MAYVILFGDVGSGKSTLMEKLTGVRGKSSDASESFTRRTEVYIVDDGSLIIADTPGANCMEEKFQQNLHIANAMNFRPISSVLLVIKAVERIDTVIENVTKYAEGFLPEDFPFDILGVCITHMDTVKWKEEQMRGRLNSCLGITSAVFTGNNTTSGKLLKDILEECKDRVKNPLKIEVDSEMFLRLFKINDSNLKILRCAKKEVARFAKMKEDFYKERKGYNQQEQKDMIFEFQEYMREQIIKAQKTLSDNNNFQLLPGPEMASEAGHIANMTNQLRVILQDIRMEAAKYNQDVDTLFKACNKCGLVWQKVEGCEGSTTCGARPSTSDDGSGTMAIFKFVWNGTKLVVSLLGQKEKEKRSAGSARAAGCGATVTWSSMRPVEAPEIFNGDSASTKDVALLPTTTAKRNWQETYDEEKSKMPEITIKRHKHN